jgi:hypothetical protein
MQFIVKITTELEINLPENHRSSEKFILWSVARIHSTGSSKIGLTQKYCTEYVLKFPKVRSDSILQKQPCQKKILFVSKLVALGRY